MHLESLENGAWTLAIPLTSVTTAILSLRAFGLNINCIKISVRQLSNGSVVIMSRRSLPRKSLVRVGT
jgi:hypothetical protein